MLCNILIYVIFFCFFALFGGKFGEILGQIESKYVIIQLYVVIWVYMGTYVMICQYSKFGPQLKIGTLAKLEHYIMFVLENVNKHWILILSLLLPEHYKKMNVIQNVNVPNISKQTLCVMSKV